MVYRPTEEEICEAADSINARRITKRDEYDDAVPTMTVILTFNAKDEIPVFIQLSYLKFKVREYIPKPMRCWRCQKFGHNENQCHSRVANCPLCAGHHDYQSCQEKARQNLKCSNCGGGT